MAKYLVTSALPYANGPIHFGHIAGAYLPADIFVRFRRLCGDEVLYICGTDEHGAPIQINAEKEDISPQAYTDKWHEAIRSSFEALRIDFDNFSRTSLPVHHEWTVHMFEALHRKGFIVAKTEDQLFCEKCQRGLPDRYVEGTCPKCGYEKARGDECPACGFNLDAAELLEPHCKTCGQPAGNKPSRHWYLDLPKLKPQLEAWLDTKREFWKPNVLGEVDKFLENLRPRAITRDLKWGVPFPLPEGEGKVFYVWFDAPIGYLSSTVEWAEKHGTPEAWKEWWKDDVELVHFIGKDNISFHCVIWPAVLLGQDERFPMPANVPANEFYNLEGRKFSTSEGWYLDIVDFMKKYPPDTLRWTLARGAPETRDTQFTWKEYQVRVNSELLGNFGNLASRVLKFIKARFSGTIPERGALSDNESAALAEAAALYAQIGEEYARFSPKHASESLLKLGGIANKLIDAERPFSVYKEDPARAGTTLNVAVTILEMVATGIAPIIPGTADKIFKQLGLKGQLAERGWEGGGKQADPAGRTIGKPKHLFQRIEDARIAAEVEALQAAAEAKAQENEGPVTEEIAEPIAFEHFLATDLRVARVAAAEEVPKANKLLKLTLDLGSIERTVVSGIKPWYKPEDVVGETVLYLANLAPRKLRGVVSEGMVLMADGPDGKPVFLQPRSEVPFGTRLK